MKHAELFAGYGGLSLAVEQAFHAELAWYSEWDEAPSRIMARHWPGVPNYGDVTTVDWNAVEPVDIISGGFPCQDVSAAGRRAGMTDGTRSNLWGAMRTAIETIRPTYVVAENVRGILSAKASSAGDLEPRDRPLGGTAGDDLRALGRVLGDLADLGYDAEWRTVRASDVGAPHRRERVFILAWQRDAAAAHRDGRRDRRGSAPPRPGGRAGADSETVFAARAPGGTGAASPVVLLPTTTASDAKGSRNATANRRDGAVFNSGTTLTDALEDFGPYGPAVERWADALDRPAPPATEVSPRGRHRLSARFAEWMMGLPDGWITDTEGVGRHEAIRAAGNGVVPQQATRALSLMIRESPPF